MFRILIIRSIWVMFSISIVSLIAPTGISQVMANEENIIAEVEENSEENVEVSESAIVPVEIYKYDISSVLVPTSYALALNPYELPIKTNDGNVSTSQIISHNYGIVNRSTRDKLITITLSIEDMNAGKIIFVDSSEEALKADEDIYAIYLTVVPSDSTGIKINGANIGKDTSAEALASVAMNKAEEKAVVLKEWENCISFKLARAIYEFGGNKEIELHLDKSKTEEYEPQLVDLAADNGGVTAFTFDGVMNPNADWGKLSKGVNVSVTYSYKNVVGDETIVNGTGAMIAN